MQWKAKLQETLDLSKSIIANQGTVPMIEMSISLTTVFEKPLISSVFKNESGQIGFSVVRVLSKRFLESFGFSTKLSDIQIDTLTVDILEYFSYETLEDIILFLKMARTGKLGSTNRGVDSNLILGVWAPAYLELKSIEREKIIQKEKQEKNNETLPIESVRKAYEKLNGNTFEKRVLDYIDKITQNINREQLEVLILEWNNDPEKKEFIRDLKRKRLTIK